MYLGLGAGILGTLGVANPLVVNQLKAAVTIKSGVAQVPNGVIDAALYKGMAKIGVANAGENLADFRASLTSIINNSAKFNALLLKVKAARQAPSTVGGIDRRYLIYGGIAVGGLALLAIATRKKGPRKNPRARRNITAAKRHDLPASLLAYPEEEKLPINTVGRTRAAMARFNQTRFANRAAKRRAYRKILRRAAHYGMDAGHFSAKFAYLR